MRRFLVLLLVGLVSACATPQQRSAQVEREVAQMIQEYGPGCERLGFKADTDPWRECILRLANKDALQRREIMTTNCIGSRGFFSCSSF
jgi:hypothetical protein